MKHPETTAPTFERRFLLGDLAAVVLAATVAITIPLDMLAIEPLDEGLYCSTTVDMLEHDTLLYPTKDGQFFSWYGKPPLVNWLQIVSTKVLGETVHGWRLPTALGLVAFITLIWASGVVLGGRAVGAIAGALALLSPEFLAMGRRIWLEDLVAPFFAAGILAYAYAIAARTPRRRWLLVASAGLFLGLAVLSKQAFALFAPAALGLVELVLRRPGWVRRALVLTLVTGAVSLWWFVLTAHVVGKPATNSWLGYHLVDRFTQVLEGHPRGPNAYGRSLQKYFGLLPFGIAIFGWVLLGLRLKVRRERPDDTRYDEQPPATTALYLGWTALFVLQYVVVGLVIKTFLAWYQVVVMLPMFVGAAYLTREAWVRAQPEWLRWLLPVALVAGLAEPTRSDGVVIAALVIALALFASKIPSRLRAKLGPPALLLGAGIVATVAANPLRPLDWREQVAVRVRAEPDTIMVGDAVSLYAWRCYLPRVIWRSWRGSCEEVARDVSGAATFVLKGEARNCVIPDTRIDYEHPRAVFLRRTGLIAD